MEAVGQDPAGALAPPTTRRQQAARRHALSVLSVIVIYTALIVAWDVFGQDVNPYFSSYPRAIAAAAIDLIQSGQLMVALTSSLGVLMQGLFYACLIGLPVGIAIGRFRFMSRTFGPIITIFFVAPREVFVPLLVVWFGLTDTSRIIFVLLSGLFPLIYNVTDGVRNVNATYVEIARTYGASELQVLREVIMPSILPFVGIGLKQAIARGLTGLVAAEFFIGVSGLGGLLQLASARFRLDMAFVVIFSLVIVGFVMSKTGDYIEASLGRWRATERAY